MTPTTTLDRHAVEAQQCVEQVVQAAATEAKVPHVVAHHHIARHLISWLKQGLSAATDGRATLWRVRVRLYGPDNSDLLAADSDAEIPADRPGETVLPGLPAVAAHLAELATTFHTAPADVQGLDTATLRHRLKSLRPTISRRDGEATWRVPYTVNDVPWLARVDIQREPTE